jgi:hypothetical protein
MIIRAIVFANNKKEALEQARAVFERLCIDQRPFDYFETFEEESKFSVCGTGRWGRMGNKKKSMGVFEVNKKTIEKLKKEKFMKAINYNQRGKEEELAFGLIYDGLYFCWKSFKESIGKIKEGIKKYNMKELFEEKDYWFKYFCHCAGQYQGSNVWLYDNDGEGIRDKKHLVNALNKWGKKDKRKIYVIPADVHH